ncbi:MAG: hypothetical protein KAT68_06430 [Bacteroidales bacterium]|nr:hypothetical protein [Bacteroidales bacterium]
MDSKSNWKEKAIERQIQLKNLKKRIKEVKLSRNNWKEKSKEHLQTINKLEDEIEHIKKNLTKIIKKK